MTVSTMSNKEWLAFCCAMRRDDLAQDPRFTTPSLRDKNVNERLQAIQECLLQRTTNENLKVLEAESVPCAPALTRNQVIDHPQVRAMETVFESEHHAAGRLRQVRNAARFEGSPAVHRYGAPLLGEHCTAILAEAGYGEEQILKLKQEGVVGFENDRSSSVASRAAE